MMDADIADAYRLLASKAGEMGIHMDQVQASRFRLYCKLLLEANRQVNLTALKTAADIMRVLFLDSLTVTLALPRALLEGIPAPRVVDVGSGAGIPGLPLKIVFSHWSILFVDATQKKMKFTRQTAEALGVADASFAALRAEEVGRMPQYRDAADICLARAVAALPSLLELCAPLVAPGGFMVFPKSGQIATECDAADAAARALGAQLHHVYPVPSSLGLGDERYIVVFKKTGGTPREYPRRVGLATSHPIGSGQDTSPRLPRDRRLLPGSGRRPGLELE